MNPEPNYLNGPGTASLPLGSAEEELQNRANGRAVRVNRFICPDLIRPKMFTAHVIEQVVIEHITEIVILGPVIHNRRLASEQAPHNVTTLLQRHQQVYAPTVSSTQKI